MSDYRKPVVVQLSNYIKPSIVESMVNEWVLNGDKNRFFDYVIDRYNGSATNAALIDAYVDRIYGKGLSVINANRNASDLAGVLSILSRKEVKKIVSDFKLFGSAVGQVRYGKGSKRTIAKVDHLERKMVAPNKLNSKGKVDKYWVCADWGKVHENTPKSFPAFGTSNENIEIFEIKPYKAGKQYYCDPDYLAGMQYAMLEEEISNFSVNHIRNGLSMGWVINFNNGQPEEEIKDEIEKKVINATTGSGNAGRVIISFNDSKEQAPSVDAIPDNANHEQWQFWANEARQQLLVAHRVTTPMLFGVKDNTGMGNNANEMKEGSKLLHETTIRPKQNEILDVFQELIAVNGISSPLTFVPLEDEEEKDDKKEEKQGIENTENKDEINLSSEQLSSGADFLINLGEEVTDEWEEVDEREVSGHVLTEASLNMVIELASGIPGDSRKRSEHDTTLFKVRYQYEGSKNPERPFCQKLIKANKVYRYEDLKAAEDKVVNEGFGVKGADKYSIFLYKGGVNCKHWWKRIIYLKKGNKRITVNQAKRMILELDPIDRKDAKWEENPKEVAKIADESNNHWRVS